MDGERSPEELKAMGVIVENTEGDKLKKFEQLRESTHLEIERETKERTEKNPKPTEDELLIGAFQEELEPQVRDAVFLLYRKGYSTESSGFYGEHGEIQQIDGYFEIDQETEEKFRLLGIQVRTELRGEETSNKKYTSIFFKPENPEIEEIKAKWKEIIMILPDKKTSDELSVSGGSEEFRKTFAPERKDLRIRMIEKRLFLGDISPEVTQELKEELMELKRDGAERAEKPLNSDKIVKQKIGIAKTLSKIEESFKTSREIGIDQLNEIIDLAEKEYGFTINQIGLLKEGIKKYGERHGAIKKYLERYQREFGENWKKDFFKDCFGDYPKGEVNLREGAVTIYWQCENLEDYALAINLPPEEAQKTFGHRKSPLDDYLDGLRGTIIVEWSGHPQHKAKEQEEKDRKSLATETHEEQHIIFDMLPDEVDYSGLEFGKLNEESSLEEVSKEVNKYLKTRRQEMERMTKNEIMAYWKDGEKTLEEIESMVLEKGSIYDGTAAVTEENLGSYLISRFGEYYKKYLLDLEISKNWDEECKQYEEAVKRAINILKEIQEHSPDKKREFIYLLSIEPLSKWERTVRLIKDKI